MHLLPSALNLSCSPLLENILEKSASMSHCFELSCSILLPNIVTNFLFKCGPIHRVFFSTQIWDLILVGNLCASPLSPTPAQGSSPMLTLLLYPDHRPKSANYPALPSKGFALFQDIIRFINECKWFLMLVCHPNYYYSTITLKAYPS